MASIDDIQKELSKIDTGYKFLYLGDNKYIKDPKNKTYVKQKLLKTDKSYRDELWGTLGNFDESRIDWSGKLLHSKTGQLESEGITRELKQLLIDATGTTDLAEKDIKERYISFDNVNFQESVNGKNSLRLTLFLEPDEGALVYYQHFEKEESDPQNNSHKGYDYDFITPEATLNDAGLVDFNVDRRDRLNYEIDILPKNIKNKSNDSDIEKCLRFVIKILTFKRKASTNENILQRTEEKIFGSEKRYQLLVFDIKKDAFVKVEENSNTIDPDLKTLFLIHGTFVNTASSYNAILKKNGSVSLLKKYLIDKNTVHKQAIAFDHPTMFDDAEENTKKLMEELNDYQPGFIFNKRLDIIGTSRGALLAKYIAIEHEKNQGENSKIPVDRIITVSGANGCGYLSKGKYYVNTLLKLCKKGSPLQKVLVSIAQLSITYVTTRSGMQLMTPGNSKLLYILDYKPKPESISRVLTLSADFEVTKAKGIDKKLKNFVIRIGDIVVQKILGKQHDFVIGTIEQEMADPYPKVNFPDNKIFNAVHGKVLDKERAWPMITEYLNS